MYEIGELNKIQELMDANVRIGDEIASEPDIYVHSSSELLVRNLAVIVDRLSIEHFNALSDDTMDKFKAMIFMASDIAPTKESDTVRFKDESDEEFDHRMNLVQPIHSFQKLTYSWNKAKTESSDGRNISKLKFATKAAAITFASTLGETYNVPEVKETIGYFQRNTSAASIVLARTLIELHNNI